MRKKIELQSVGIILCVCGIFLFSGYVGPVLKAQNTTVSGQVTTSNGQTLTGVNIAVKGTTTGTATDAHGKYSLNVPSLQDTLAFSFIGYQTQTIPINGRNTINVVMKTQILSGQEVVVVGFGTQKRQNVTGSVTMIDSSQFNTGEISQPGQLIQGKVAGLSIAKPGSNPNEGYDIHLRGINTLGANSQPLIVLNGVPGASLADIDPNDIKSMSVLKDASASAIYGTRGSNGVIIIKTKSGPSSSKPSFHAEYRGSGTYSAPYREIQIMSASQYKKFLQYHGKLIGADLSSSNLGSSNDFMDYITKKGLSQTHYLALSGGNSSTNYRFSFNYRNEKGILKNTGFGKIDGRLNLNQSALNNNLQLHVNLSAGRKNAQLGFPQAFRHATTFNPTSPIRSNKPLYAKWGGYFQQQFFLYANPAAIVDLNQHLGDGNHVRGNVKATYDFSTVIPGLSASVLYSERNNRSREGIYYPSTSFWRGFTRNGVAELGSYVNKHRLIQTTVHYTKEIGQHFHIKVLGGYSWQEFTNKQDSLAGGDFITDHFGLNNFSAAEEFKKGLGVVNSSENRNKLIAGFGRINLRLKNTYLLAGSYRREGSSRFGKNNKWGSFYSVSGGIRLDNLFNMPNVQQLKIRAGYGVTGNDAPGDYLSLLRFQPGGDFLFNGTYIPTYAPSSNPNPDLKWETKVAVDIGLDFSLLKSRLNGSFDFYTNKTKNLLLNFNVPVPPNLFNTEWINIGELSNKGFELQASYKIFQTKNFQWTTNFTGSRPIRTKIVSLSNKNLKFGSQQIVDNAGTPGLNSTFLVRVKEGQPLGQIWGPVFEGITNDGHWKFKDLNGDGVINTADDKVIGNGQPKWLADWSNSFNYKNWNLGFSFRGVFGHDLANMTRAFYEIPNRVSTYNILASTWKVKNLIDPAQFSSFDVENASYVKLQNLTLGYTFRLKNVQSVSSVNLSLTGQNLFTITGYSGPDPSVRYSDANNPLWMGIARRGSYFNARQITFSVDIKF
jgi:iron complex outermembrane receptor protein